MMLESYNTASINVTQAEVAQDLYIFCAQKKNNAANEGKIEQWPVRTVKARTVGNTDNQGNYKCSNCAFTIWQ